MKKILVFGMTDNPGGIESFIVNYYKNMDRQKIHCDFLCNFFEKAAFEEELETMGARFFHIPARHNAFFRYHKCLDDFFKEHAKDYDAIWVNVCSLANIDYLSAARKYDIPVRIIHSHNAQNMDGWARGLLHHANRFRVDRYATDFWACEGDAARWFYRDDLMKKSIIIRNAIDADKMRFDPKKRAKYRKEIHAEDAFVLGNIGRLHFQKNQAFAMDVLYEYRKINPRAVLLLVGQGMDEQKLRQKAAGLGLQDHVIFTGKQFDIQGWLSAMDFFIFPSVFEGLGMAALEAQANGLNTLATKGDIPPELKVLPSFTFQALEDGAKSWAKTIEDLRNKYPERENPEKIKELFSSCGYDIHAEAKKLEKRFLEMTEKHPANRNGDREVLVEEINGGEKG